MGKASELDDDLRRHPLTREELEQFQGPRPKLRLRAEVLERALGSSAQVQDVLELVNTQGADAVALRDPQTDAIVVVVPAGQYLELVTAYIRDRNLAEVKLSGQVTPSEATFSELGVEQVNPRDTWLRIEGYDPGQPTPEG